MNKIRILVFSLLALMAFSQVMGMENEERATKRARLSESLELQQAELEGYIQSSDYQAIIQFYYRYPDFFKDMPCLKKKHFANLANKRYKLAKENKQNIDSARRIANLFKDLGGKKAFFSRPGCKSLALKPLEVISHLVATERARIHGCLYNFTLTSLANDMANQRDKNGNPIAIELVLDRSNKQTSPGRTVIGNLIRAGAKLFIPKADFYRETSYMHHKFLEFYRTGFNDKNVLVIGSFNPTNNAVNNNWEDITIIDNPEVIKDYGIEFKAIKDRSDQLLANN